MADDEPSLTRWSFLFGRRRLPDSQTEDKEVSNGSSSGETSNVNGHVTNTSDMAIYEQYRNQGNSTHSNGVISNGVNAKPQKSLLPPFESAEMRTLAESLCRDIIRGSPDVKWDSNKGLHNAKRLLKEAVVMPIKYPSYFTGLLSPWKGILLFGPPGTGKTMLAKAVATECNTTFFNISASSVVSKWRGMLPWELDAAMLRRLEKRGPLPEAEARRSMFEELLPSVPGEEELPYDILVDRTEGYSGSDIRLVCKETAMQPLRRLMGQLEDRQEVVPEDELPKVGLITHEDIDVALRNTRPSAHLHAHRYDKFNNDYGSQILK